MAGFRERSIEDRLGADSLAGQPAEQAFRQYMAGRGYVEGEDFCHYGFDRVSTKKGLVATMHPMVQHGPDFFQLGGHAWECQGFGRNGRVVFKLEKLLALWRYWQEPLANRQVRFFLFDQPNNAYYLVPIQTVMWAVQSERAQKVILDDRKPAFEVPVELFREQLLTDPFAWLKKTREAEEKARAADEAAAAAETAELVRRYGGAS